MSEPVKSMVSWSPVDGDLHVQVDVGVAERIVVDVRVGLVHAVGPRGDFLAEAAGRVVDHEVDGLFDGVGAVGARCTSARRRAASCAAPICARRSPM